MPNQFGFRRRSRTVDIGCLQAGASNYCVLVFRDRRMDEAKCCPNICDLLCVGLSLRYAQKLALMF